jgi:hypothetical protein
MGLDEYTICLLPSPPRWMQRSTGERVRRPSMRLAGTTEVREVRR